MTRKQFDNFFIQNIHKFRGEVVRLRPGRFTLAFRSASKHYTDADDVVNDVYAQIVTNKNYELLESAEHAYRYVRSYLSSRIIMFETIRKWRSLLSYKQAVAINGTLFRNSNSDVGAGAGAGADAGDELGDWHTDVVRALRTYIDDDDYFLDLLYRDILTLYSAKFKSKRNGIAYKRNVDHERVIRRLINRDSQKDIALDEGCSQQQVTNIKKRLEDIVCQLLDIDPATVRRGYVKRTTHPMISYIKNDNDNDNEDKHNE